MKVLKILLFISSLIAIGVLISSCGNKNASGDKTETNDKQGKEYTSAYICPMHCEGSGSDKPGKCPKCGMTYEKNPDHKMDKPMDGMVDQTYACSMHPEITGNKGDKCSKCGMELTAVESEDNHSEHNH